MKFSGYLLSIDSSEILAIVISQRNPEVDISRLVGSQFLENVRLENSDIIYFGDHEKSQGLTKAVEVEGLAAPIIGNILIVGQSRGEFLPRPRMTIDNFAKRTRIVTPVIEFLTPDKTSSGPGYSSIRTSLQRTMPRVCVGDACKTCPG